MAENKKVLYRILTMAITSLKAFPTQYMYVQRELKDGKEKFRLHMPGVSAKRYDTEREAAIAADMQLLKQGKEPVNILKRK
jgi:hypothetical protein